MVAAGLEVPRQLEENTHTLWEAPEIGVPWAYVRIDLGPDGPGSGEVVVG